MSGTAAAAATFCATLADEWVRSGVTDAVIAPGSRSTPIAVAVARQPGLRLHVFHDERSAAFGALGIGVVTHRPAIVLTTSGTAAVELHPAVVEAHHAGVPVVCVTADRPPELQGVAAPQTIDQQGLYGGAVRWWASPGVPDDATRSTWRSLAAQSVAMACGAAGDRPGPVHLNLAFREPLVGDPGPLPEGRAAGAQWHDARRGAPLLDDDTVDDLAGLVDHDEVVIVAGAGAGDAEPVHELADAGAWPVFADALSGARLPRSFTIATADALLRAPTLARALQPRVIVRFGRMPASKVVGQWLAACGATEIVVSATGEWVDPSRTADLLLVADPTDTARRLADRVREKRGDRGDGAPAAGWYGDTWARLEAAAQRAIDETLSPHDEPTEPRVARSTLAAVPDGGALMVSSSMPVRDVEWFGAPRAGISVFANRGANGIDGVVSTAVGIAIACRAPTVALLGDLAFLHDSNGLLGLADRRLDLTFVVVDNDGGGIFSFLPQASALPTDEFEALLGTPHHLDITALARAYGVAAVEARTPAEVESMITDAVTTSGSNVVVVRTDRTANVAIHAELERAITAAVEQVMHPGP